MKMTEETKKISFGFSKLKRPTTIFKKVNTNKSEVEFVDSFDGVQGKFSYKGNVRCDETVKKELIIPLIGTKSAFEVIQSKLKENNANKKDKGSCDSNSDIGKTNSTVDNGNEEKIDKGGLEKSNGMKDVEKEMSIDELAAKEILNDVQNSGVDEKTSNVMVIKQSTKSNKIVEEKEIQIDYENVPVNDFGLAMLRGMGWTPQTGIGKEQRVVQVVAPKLRPKGLGLGADKVVAQQSLKDSDLTISIKGYVKFVSGLNKGSYGQVEAMDDDNGRVIVKLALGGTVSASEVILMPVSKKDYDKNSKVLNYRKYENFQEKPNNESDSKDRGDREDTVSRRTKNDSGNMHRKEKYDRRNSKGRVNASDEEASERDDKGRYSSSSSSSSERKTQRRKRRKRSREDSRERKHKKIKKKKKEKKRKYSSEHDTDSSVDRKYKRESSSRKNSHRSKDVSHR